MSWLNSSLTSPSCQQRVAFGLQGRHFLLQGLGQPAGLLCLAGEFVQALLGRNLLHQVLGPDPAAGAVVGGDFRPLAVLGYLRHRQAGAGGQAAVDDLEIIAGTAAHGNILLIADIAYVLGLDLEVGAQQADKQ